MLYSEPTSTLINATAPLPTYARPLSDNEQSYFLQSRANGANDMIIEAEFRGPAVLATYNRISLVWAILRVQHPLLASSVEMEAGNYQSCHFVYTPPPTPASARLQAESCIELQWRSPHDDTVGVGSNGPGDRQLSSNILSYLVFQSFAGDIRLRREYRLFFHFAHCSMDGVAAHLLINAFFTLLGGSCVPGQPPRSDQELEQLLELEWAKRWLYPSEVMDNVIPVCAEERLPQLTGHWRIVASKIEHSARQKRIIGGHAFPRKPAPSTKSTSRMNLYSVDDTRTILAKCRAARVTISNALFALCSMAWIRLIRHGHKSQLPYNPKLPIIIYSAVSLRHLFTSLDDMWQPSPLQSPKKQLESWAFLAVSYFNAVLPGFIPSSASTPVREAAVMWHRARCVREQFIRYSQSPMFIPRVHITTMERGERARKFAKEDDEALLKARVAGPVPAPFPSSPASASTSPSSSTASTTPVKAPPAPSIALMGISQLGNLDQFYDTRLYPSLDVFYVQGHTRKNQGGMLVFSHTFRGRLALMLGWDEAGFRPGVVEAFWAELDKCVREYVINAPEKGEVANVKL